MVQRLVFYSHPSHISDRVKYSSFEATQAMDFYCTPFSSWFTQLSHVATCVIKAVSEPKNMINQDSDGDSIMVMVMTKIMCFFTATQGLSSLRPDTRQKNLAGPSSRIRSQVSAGSCL